MNATRSGFALAAALVALSPGGGALANVSNDQVQSQHIQEADGTSGQNTNSGSGVKTLHIQDGAVTASKLGITCPDGFYLQFTMFVGWTLSHPLIQMSPNTSRKTRWARSISPNFAMRGSSRSSFILGRAA